ncbi:hypothetical protein [Peribacillus sp. TH14]|uniref:hypothetical protein n=1 Tax=Peribacillus sp. TH14 TaxID=2798481 RepID=UPI001913A964|nr:hypothetical protein [Peribacillus sp. TH14]MBK5500692.1 hypothetical protein [Peribacillus sp. TH14]
MNKVNINSYIHLVRNYMGIQDWTIAIKQAILEADPGDILFLPNNISYNTFSTINVDKAISIKGGAKIVSHHNGVALLFKPTLSSFGNGLGIWGADSNRLDVDISVEKKVKDWSDDSVGIQIFNSYFGIFRFPRITGFTTGLIVTAEKILTNAEGSSYNTFYIGRMENHRYGIVMKSRKNSGWCTENTFYGGSLGNGFGVPEDNFQVSFDSDESGWNNSNKFYNVSFEGFYTKCIIGNFTLNNDFYSCRYEMPHLTELVNWGAITQNNGLYNGTGLGSNLEKIIDKGRYNRISSTSGYYTGYVEYFDNEFFSFIKSGTPMKPIAGKKVAPIGNLPQKTIYVIDGIVNLDLAIARDFYVLAQSDIMSINFINVPLNSKGLEFQVSFSQDSSNGYSISGFPNAFKFGQRSEKPMKRAWGMDGYSLKNISNTDPSFIVLSQYTS